MEQGSRPEARIAGLTSNGTGPYSKDLAGVFPPVVTRGGATGDAT